MLVFGLNSGAYISEIMRSGIQSVDPVQMEAGRAVGLSFGTTMSKIVIPQAVKNILPTLGNELDVYKRQGFFRSLCPFQLSLIICQLSGSGRDLAVDRFLLTAQIIL